MYIETGKGMQSVMMQNPRIGTLGYLTLFAGALASAFLLPPEGLLLALIVSLLIGILFFPRALKRLLRWRWLLFLLLLVLPNALWLGEADRVLLGVPFSLSGFWVGVGMALRAAVMLFAVVAFSTSIDIAEVAGLLERLGLRGLGFSMGVAVNLLPSLLDSYRNAWHTLRMRGGFRRERLRGLRLLLVTVVANALRRADEIALAAEVRAFQPDNPQKFPLKRGAMDRLLMVIVLLGITAQIVLF